MAEQGTVRDALVDGALVAVGSYAASTLILAGLALPRGGLGPLGVLSVPVWAFESHPFAWLVYVVVLGLLALTHRRLGRPARLWLSLPGAVVAWVVGTVVQSLVAFADPFVFVVLGVLAALQFAAASAAAVLVVSQVRRAGAARVAGGGGEETVPTGSRATSRRDLVGVGALVLAVLVAAGLPMQWVSVYFRIWGPSPEPTAGQVLWFVLTLAVAAALAITGLVIAIRARRRVAGAVVVLLAVGALGFVFQVPAGTVWLDPSAPPEYEVDRHWQECAWDAGRPGCGG